MSIWASDQQRCPLTNPGKVTKLNRRAVPPQSTEITHVSQTFSQFISPFPYPPRHTAAYRHDCFQISLRQGEHLCSVIKTPLHKLYSTLSQITQYNSPTSMVLTLQSNCLKHSKISLLRYFLLLRTMKKLRCWEFMLSVSTRFWMLCFPSVIQTGNSSDLWQVEENITPSWSCA